MGDGIVGCSLTQGKGDVNCPCDQKKFEKGHDAINWPSKAKNNKRKLFVMEHRPSSIIPITASCNQI
jgi:hypothetical protein